MSYIQQITRVLVTAQLPFPMCVFPFPDHCFSRFRTIALARVYDIQKPGDCSLNSWLLCPPQHTNIIQQPQLQIAPFQSSAIGSRVLFATWDLSRIFVLQLDAGWFFPKNLNQGPIPSMYDIFTYMNGWFLWFSCRSIYQSHGWYGGVMKKSKTRNQHRNSSSRLLRDVGGIFGHRWNDRLEMSKPFRCSESRSDFFLCQRFYTPGKKAVKNVLVSADKYWIVDD